MRLLQYRGQVSRASGADSRRRLHGLSGPRHQRGVRQPGDRSGTRVLAEEWLEDPVRWYERIHPEDKQRWSLEAAEMFLSGKPLRSSYRVIARDGRVVWFHCDASMVRRQDGQPWFIHGVAFDITDLKDTERPCSRNATSFRQSSTPSARWSRCSTGKAESCDSIAPANSPPAIHSTRCGRHIWDFFLLPEEAERVLNQSIAQLGADLLPQDYQSHWMTRHGYQPADRVVQFVRCLDSDGTPTTSSPRASTSRSASTWKEHCSKSAHGSSAASARICTTGWDSI